MGGGLAGKSTYYNLVDDTGTKPVPNDRSGKDGTHCTGHLGCGIATQDMFGTLGMEITKKREATKLVLVISRETVTLIKGAKPRKNNDNDVPPYTLNSLAPTTETCDQRSGYQVLSSPSNGFIHLKHAGVPLV